MTIERHGQHPSSENVPAEKCLKGSICSNIELGNLYVGNDNLLSPIHK